MLEIQLKEAHGFLPKFASMIGVPVENGQVNIPPHLGNGYLRGYMLGNSIGVMIRDYEFNEDILTRRIAAENSPERIVMSFNNVFISSFDNNSKSEVQSISNLPSVQIGKGKLRFEMLYPSKTKFRSILIAIESQALKNLLVTNEENIVLKSILESSQPLLFEEFISPKIQHVAMDIIKNDVPLSLQNFYIRLKAEEMICLLFAELLKRENSNVYSLNDLDVQKIYQIRNTMISTLDVPPVLTELAKDAGMSESKLKRLFKQIFGNSPFNYYQSFRMKEAARLLKEHKLTVSEVGFQLGFTNLSHFAKVFEEHIGSKPKRYSLMN